MRIIQLKQIFHAAVIFGLIFSYGYASDINGCGDGYMKQLQDKNKLILYFSDMPEVKFETSMGCIKEGQCKYMIYSDGAGGSAKTIKDSILISNICSSFVRTTVSERNDGYGIYERGEAAAFDKVNITKYNLQNDYGSITLIILNFFSSAPELNWGFWDGENTSGTFATVGVTHKQVWTGWLK